MDQDCYQRSQPHSVRAGTLTYDVDQVLARGTSTYSGLFLCADPLASASAGALGFLG
jgi:hypothetical protein